MSIIRVVRKFNSILTQHQIHRILQLAFLMLIGGILETLSVVLIYPFMNMIMSPEQMIKKNYIIAICNLLAIESYRVLLILIAVAIAVIYILKNAYLLFEYNVQYYFVYGNMFMMQKKILDVLMHRPYEFFLNINSGEIVRIVGSDTTQAFSILVTLLNLFTELVVAVMLTATMFISAPVITICISVVLIFLLLLIIKVLKPTLQRAGKRQQVAEAGMNKWLLQSIHGIKEIKVSSTEKFFQDNYDSFGVSYVACQRKRAVLSMIPRFFLEAVCMGTMFIVVAVMLYHGMEFETIVPMISVVAMAAIRILPSINRISAAATTIAYNEPMLDKLIENVTSMEGKIENQQSNNDQDQVIIDFPRVVDSISMRNIKYKYPKSDNYVIDGANMVIKRGESVGIVGTTGAGKTTSVDIILGLLKPESGRIEVDGIDIKNNLRGWLSKVGYIPQTIFMLNGSIRDNVAFGVNPEGISDEMVWRALDEASLADFVKNLPDGLETEIGERGIRLSGGQKQRIGIARALYLDPPVLILDEATSALDNETESAIMESISKLQGSKTMIIIAHRLTTIERCDKIFRVENGKIVQDKISNI